MKKLEEEIKMYDIKKIRKDFPILKRKINNKTLIYFDNAATTQKPQQVIDALSEFYSKYNANIHRGIHTLSQEASEMYDKAHVIVGKFINAKVPMEETIFVRNATEGLNLIMYGWAMHNLKKGDEILSTEMEHHSNIVPWQFLKEKGVKVNFVNLKLDGTLDMEDLKKKINKNTKIVTCVHASNVLGTINPIKEIGKIAKQYGALFVVDGAQSVPHMPVDVQDLGADFFVFSGHKMLAPTGIGALYGKKELLEEMHPFMGGGDMISEVKLDGSKWNSLPWKFEAGTPNIADGVAFGTAVNYLEKLGMEHVRAHEKELIEYGIKKLSAIKGADIYGPLDTTIRGGVLTFNLKNIESTDVAAVLDSEYGIAIRTGMHCAQPLTEKFNLTSTCRASFYIYNTKEEIDVFIGAIKKVKEVFNR
ncbi:MAG: cysteine desulfurase [Nanoarchaeota archaeon]